MEIKVHAMLSVQTFSTTCSTIYCSKIDLSHAVLACFYCHNYNLVCYEIMPPPTHLLECSLMAPGTVGLLG